LCSGKKCKEARCNGQGLWDFIICADELGGKEYLTTIYNESIGMYIDKIECEMPILFEYPIAFNNDSEIVTYFRFLIKDRTILVREDSFKYEPILHTTIL
jgi:hypothetical protein